MKSTFNKSNGYNVSFDRKRKMVIANHQLIIEKKLGRKLHRNELVHHIDEDKSNNKICNLKLVNKSAHNKLHSVWKGNKNPSRMMSHLQRSAISKIGWKHRKHNKHRENGENENE